MNLSNPMQLAINRFVGTAAVLEKASTCSYPLRVSTVPKGRLERKYAVLPSAENPRVWLPLGYLGATLTAVQLYRPYSRKGRAFKTVLSNMIRAGLTSWASTKVMITSSEPLQLERIVTEITGEQNPVLALSLGRQAAVAKLTVQAMRPDGTILAYLKIPLTDAACRRVRHEADVLRTLQAAGNLHARIPEILFAGETDSGFVLVQTAGPATTGPRVFGALQQQFLSALSAFNPSVKSGSALVEEVSARWLSVRDVIDPGWVKKVGAALQRARRELSYASIPCGISHGDFAPWNTAVDSAGRLFVFDWESSISGQPRLWDVFHFHSQVVAGLGGRANYSFSCSAEQALFCLYAINFVAQLVAEEGVTDGAALAPHLRQAVEAYSD